MDIQEIITILEGNTTYLNILSENVNVSAKAIIQKQVKRNNDLVEKLEQEIKTQINNVSKEVA